MAPPWPRVRLRDALLEETGVDITKASRDELAELAGEDAEPDDDWAALVDTLQGKLIEPKLIQPTFIIDLPLAIWPLVKPVPEHPQLLAAAFDGIVAGMEIIGGGTDINDPIEQRRHFVEQRERQESGAEETPHEHDEEFVRALEYGMLTASGSRPRRRPPDDDPQRRQDPARRDPLPLDARGRRGERLAAYSICTQALRLVLDLERRVVDAELALDQLGELEPGAVAVGVALDGDVGGEGRELGGDLPDVQVVDLDHARLLGHAPADPLRVDPLRRGLEEDPAGVAQQAEGGAQHQPGDQQRGDRVGRSKPVSEDHDGGDRGADEGEEVGEEVLEAALDVEALAVGAGEDRGGGEVDDDPGEGDDEDQAAVDAGRRRTAAAPPRSR